MAQRDARLGGLCRAGRGYTRLAVQTEAGASTCLGVDMLG